MVDWSRARDLSTAMLRVGVLGYGGGPAVIPLFRYEAVTRFHWLSDEEFGETLAFATALPGPVATKLSAYLGYRVLGFAGAIMAIVLNILPSSIATVILAGAFTRLYHYTVVRDMVSAVIPVITVMLAMMAYQFGERARRGLGVPLGLALMAIAFLLLWWIHVNSAIVIVLFLLYGTAHFALVRKWRTWRGNDGGQR